MITPPASHATSIIGEKQSGSPAPLQEQVLPKTRTVPRWVGFLVPLFLLALWMLLAKAGALPAAQIPSPGEVARAFWDEVRTGRLFKDLIASLWRVVLGYSLGVAVGVPLGLLLGLRLWARAALLPTVNFLRSLSSIPWLPFAPVKL